MLSIYALGDSNAITGHFFCPEDSVRAVDRSKVHVVTVWKLLIDLTIDHKSAIPLLLQVTP